MIQLQYRHGYINPLAPDHKDSSDPQMDSLQCNQHGSTPIRITTTHWASSVGPSGSEASSIHNSTLVDALYAMYFVPRFVCSKCNCATSFILHSQALFKSFTYTNNLCFFTT